MVCLIRRERAAQLLSSSDVERRFLALILDMDMSTMMPNVFLGLHPDEYPLEHSKCCHYAASFPPKEKTTRDNATAGRGIMPSFCAATRANRGLGLVIWCYYTIIHLSAQAGLAGKKVWCRSLSPNLRHYPEFVHTQKQWDSRNKITPVSDFRCAGLPRNPALRGISRQCGAPSDSRPCP